jgi:hypothetical protein
MSTSARPTPAAVSSVAEPVIKVISHTGLLYWWPVWLVGFVLSGLTFFGGGRMAIVPEGTKVRELGPTVYELTVPGRAGAPLQQAAEATARGESAFPVRMSTNRDYGMVYVVVLLLVIFGSNVPLRGLWSLVAILLLLMVTVLFAGLDLWGWILERLGGLHVEISLAGYLLPSVVLLVLWLVAVFGFDRLRYIRFKAGQFAVHKEIGDAVEVYDTMRVTIRKQRSDLFRHWILGMGAGDLIINIPNQSKEIMLPNVLFVAGKFQQIADLMKVRPVTAD